MIFPAANTLARKPEGVRLRLPPDIAAQGFSSRPTISCGCARLLHLPPWPWAPLAGRSSVPTRASARRTGRRSDRIGPPCPKKRRRRLPPPPPPGGPRTGRPCLHENPPPPPIRRPIL